MHILAGRRPCSASGTGCGAPKAGGALYVRSTSLGNNVENSIGAYLAPRLGTQQPVLSLHNISQNEKGGLRM